MPGPTCTSKSITFVSLLTSFYCFPFGLGQVLPATCQPNRLYNYGVCRLNGCIQNETYVPGRSYCENFGNLFTRLAGGTYTRCARHTPCCVWGGMCRTSCFPNESSLSMPSDCNGSRAGVCCLHVPTTQVKDEVCGNTTNALMVPRTATATATAGVRVGSPTDHPWMVRLLYQGPVRGLCTGALVSEDTVVTVAHCVQGFTFDQLQVVVGDFDLTVTDPEEEVINVHSVEISPSFVRGLRGSDIAVLKLARPVHTAATKWPVCLPRRTNDVTDRQLSQAGLQMGGLRSDQCYVVGWGTTEEGHVSQRMRSARVQLMSKTACQIVFNRASFVSGPLPRDIICSDTSQTGNNRWGCLFDDGAMLTCLNSQNRFVIVGLVSEFTCDRLPTLFTRVESFAEALRSRVN